MVYNGKPIKMDDLGVPLFLETPILRTYPFQPLTFQRSLPLVDQVPSVPACVAQNLGFSPPSPGECLLVSALALAIPVSMFFPKIISCYRVLILDLLFCLGSCRLLCSWAVRQKLGRPFFLLTCATWLALDCVQSQRRDCFSLNQRFWLLTFLVMRAAVSNARCCRKSTAILATQRDSEDVLVFHTLVCILWFPFSYFQRSLSFPRTLLWQIRSTLFPPFLLLVQLNHGLQMVVTCLRSQWSSPWTRPQSFEPPSPVFHCWRGCRRWSLGDVWLDLLRMLWRCLLVLADKYV